MQRLQSLWLRRQQRQATATLSSFLASAGVKTPSSSSSSSSATTTTTTAAATRVLPFGPTMLRGFKLGQAARLNVAAAAAAAWVPARAFSTRTTATTTATNANSGAGGFLRSVRLPAFLSGPSTITAAKSLGRTPFCIPHRNMSVRGKGGDKDAGGETEEEGGDPNKKKTTTESEQEEEKKTDGEGEDTTTAGGSKKGGPKPKPKKAKNSFGDHIRGLKGDYAKFPDIYNSANLINFIIFTVFCLCSTGSNTEEKWWLDQWGLDNSFRPWTWLLHSFLTNNFLSMTYAMILLHTLCHGMLPTLGSRNLMIFVAATAVISGAVMWVGQRLYYGGSESAPEKQFGPWDVVHALFVMYYFQFAMSPVAVLASFSGWIKYAVLVGEVCILYFDWQPSVVGTVVGLVLCRTVPIFRMKPIKAGV